MEGNKIFPKVFMWMFVGLIITFGVGAFVMSNENMLYNIFETNLYWFIFVVQIAVVVWLSARINKMKEGTATVLFLLYSGLTGLTFSSIFVVFELDSIMMVFAITALLFAVFACIGYFTKMDLTKFGTYLLMALLGIILVSVINIFLGNDTLDLVLCIIGVLVFVGYTAYDMQKIKMLAITMENEHKVAIIGALELYLDFINLFLRLLQLFGNSRD